PLAETLDIDTPAFGGADLRGVSFDSPVPTRIAVGQTVTLTGRVVATDRSDFSSLSLAFWLPNSKTPVNFGSAVSASGCFSISLRFTDAQKGAYSLADYLFWSGSGSQYPRTSSGTVVVE